MELCRRRGNMITIAVVTIGLPSIFLLVRVLGHAIAPKSFGPAGGATVFAGLVLVVMYVFGFLVAALLGSTAGSADLTDGMFRHLVVTGRSRVALYLARIPAGLAIIWSMVAIGYAIVCVVCCLTAPTAVNYQGASVPPGLSEGAFVAWAGQHPDQVFCDFSFPGPPPTSVRCPGQNVLVGPGAPNPKGTTPQQLAAAARKVAAHFGNYEGYAALFLAPPISLMVGTGLWLELEALVGFVVALGLSSLLGQRTIAVILMIVLEIILTPVLARNRIPYLLNAQRGIAGVAMDHLEPSGLRRALGSGSQMVLVPEATFVAVIVVAAWLVGWTCLGAWRMATRDA